MEKQSQESVCSRLAGYWERSIPDVRAVSIDTFFSLLFLSLKFFLKHCNCCLFFM